MMQYKTLFENLKTGNLSEEQYGLPLHTCPIPPVVTDELGYQYQVTVIHYERKLGNSSKAEAGCVITMCKPVESQNKMPPPVEAKETRGFLITSDQEEDLKNNLNKIKSLGDRKRQLKDWILSWFGKNSADWTTTLH